MPPRKNPDLPPKTSADYGNTYSCRLRFSVEQERLASVYIDQFIEGQQKKNPAYTFRDMVLDLLYERGMGEPVTDTQQLILDKLEVVLGQIEELKANGVAIPAPKAPKKAKTKGVSQTFMDMISQSFHED